MRIQDKNSKLMPAGGGNTNLTLHACAEAGDLIALQALLRQNPALLNQRTVLTPLHVAAGLNRVEIAKYLLDWEGPGKVELEAKNVYGETPLHVAAKNGCNEAATLVLDYGAYIEARTNKSMTPLHLAVGYALQSGDNSIVKTLSEYNADFSAMDNEGKTPFGYVPAGLENVELFTLLCQHVTTQVQNVTQQIYNTTGYSWAGFPSAVNQSHYYGTTNYSFTSNQNVEEPKNYDSGIKGKMDEFEHELSKIVGLCDLKLQLRKWAKGMLLDEKRRAMGLNLGPRKPPHMAFLGNPGTGKTTVARILGKLLHSVEVLSTDNVTEVQRTDLVGEYLGQTGPKTRKKIEEAMGGILFVDEAYRLAPSQTAGDHVDYGVEALEEIMSVLEDGNIVVIFAGYTEPMKRVFSSNEGFCRRVTHFFQFDDFTCKDLAEMLMIKMSKQDEKSRLYGFKLHPSCTYDAVLAVIERNSTEKLRNKMNGGLVDHMLNNARENLDSRLSFDSKGDELLTITLGDLEGGLKLLSQRVNID
ncbi:uncharacterized protein LOC105173814 isoform X2 [Sesamum indicum]|uniref:Uncharacterized protein LOC105173814 isoform X2 n=1 Tax=Sesamum indicum TaxID=4182 RepID=A0A8M8V423_SESIN|nr:uncharacterized protein LOC105173814 isoform X2 [Sesamum indicum]